MCIPVLGYLLLESNTSETHPQVMKYLFNLTFSDILYIPSKIAGSEGFRAHPPLVNESDTVSTKSDIDC